MHERSINITHPYLSGIASYATQRVMGTIYISHMALNDVWCIIPADSNITHIK